METAPETVESPVQKAPEEPSSKARVFAGVLILLIVGALAIAIIPGWRDAFMNAVFGNQQERLLNELEEIDKETPDEYRASGAELLLQLENTDEPEN